jgi:hypothetical protein
MSEDLIALLLVIALAAIAIHTIFAGLLRPRLDSSLQSQLYAWGHVRGGNVQSLKFRYLLPWIKSPNIPPQDQWLFIISRYSANVATLSIVCLVIFGIFFTVS